MTFARYPSLAGRIVYVSGGASGIGADLVRAFHGQGAKVAFVDLAQEAGEALAHELGKAGAKPLFLRCDVTRPDDLRATFGEVRRALGPVSVLINNAANDQRHEVDDVTPEYWTKTIDVNLSHHFFAAQAARPQMKEAGGGSIVNFSSIAWHFGAGAMAAYATAKAGVVGLTHALARAFGSDDIRVNAIEPGAVMTERQRQLWYKTQESVDAMVERQILKRVLLGEEVARMALFLASDDSRMITKQTFVVDAGMR